MGQPDLASNSLTAHTDVFADIINAIVYGGKTVLEANNLKPFYPNSTVPRDSKLKDFTVIPAWRISETAYAMSSGVQKTSISPILRRHLR